MLKIYTQLRYIVFLFCCGLFWQGCNIINPKEQDPTYIHIDSFNFVPNTAITEPLTLSHKITCVWVSYNGQSIGVFDLPATFPVVAKGTGVLNVSPGVVIDGLNDLLGINPFYEPDTFTFAAQPGKIINHIATTRYYSKVKVQKIADFETLQTNFRLDYGNIPMTTVSADSLVFEGHGSGSIYLTNPGVDSSIDSTQYNFTITPGSAAFIEFDYKSTIPFYVGLQSNLGSNVSSSPYYLAGIFPSAGWQKFYLSVQDYAAQFTGFSYNLYIKTSLPAGASSGRVLIDNVQLITY